jgi:DNA-binding response OmpR family regulator
MRAFIDPLNKFGAWHFMRIAVLDDDVALADLIAESLVMDGHTCHVFSEGRALVKHLSGQSFDLLLLGGNIPDMPGEAILRVARQSLHDHLPVLFVTGRSQETGNATTLNTGADDDVEPPLATGVLRTRVKSLLRRAYQLNHAATTEVLGEFEFERESKQVVFRGTPVTLTMKEFELASLFFRYLGQPLSRSYIREAIWKQDAVLPSRTIDTHISTLRSKLGLGPGNGYRLAPVYGYGYRLERIKTGGDTTVAASGIPPGAGEYCASKSVRVTG